MKKKRLLVAVVIGALLAVGVAVPVAAHVIGRQAQSGNVRMYHYVIDDKATAADPQYVIDGRSSVSLTYTTMVEDYELGWLLSAGHLKARTKYALVSVWDVTKAGGDMTTNAWWVKVLDTGRTTRWGRLFMKGDTDALHVPEGGRADWARSYSTDIWLVPYADLVDSQTSSGYYLPVAGNATSWNLDEDWWLTSLGIPADGLDNNAAAEDN